MFARFRFYLGKATRSLWFRPAVYALGAFAALAVTPIVEPFLPWEWKELISANTNETVLSILASSLLAVAIFSLSTMVAALRSASNSATPRARPLLVGDAAAQNAISTFIGAFLFSLLGVIGTLLDIFNSTGRVILFVLTLILVFVVVATFIRWLQRLSNMGDVMEAIRRVETAASNALDLSPPPVLPGARRGPDFSGGDTVWAEAPGFVQAIAIDRLEALCEREACRMEVLARTGDFADARHALVRLDGPADKDMTDEIRAAFTLGDAREFDQDPRLGLIVLSEVASKALSPGINDPGTAIGATRAAQRVLDAWARRTHDRDALSERSPVSVAPLEPSEAMDCAFSATAFDGAERPEIASTLLSVYAGLKAVQPLVFGPAADAMAADLSDRVEARMANESDRARIRDKLRRLGFA